MAEFIYCQYELVYQLYGIVHTSIFNEHTLLAHQPSCGRPDVLPKPMSRAGSDKMHSGRNKCLSQPKSFWELNGFGAGPLVSCPSPATWTRSWKLPWREAGPPNHLDDPVDLDQGRRGLPPDHGGRPRDDGVLHEHTLLAHWAPRGRPHVRSIPGHILVHILHGISYHIIHILSEKYTLEYQLYGIVQTSLFTEHTLLAHRAPRGRSHVRSIPGRILVCLLRGISKIKFVYCQSSVH